MSFYVTLDNFASNLHLEPLYVPAAMTDIKITSKEVNRPGLILSGYTDLFDPTRIQVIGRMEYSYLNSLPHEQKMSKLKTLFSTTIPAVIVTSNLLISSEVVELA